MPNNKEDCIEILGEKVSDTIAPCDDVGEDSLNTKELRTKQITTPPKCPVKPQQEHPGGTGGDEVMFGSCTTFGTLASLPCSTMGCTGPSMTPSSLWPMS